MTRIDTNLPINLPSSETTDASGQQSFNPPEVMPDVAPLQFSGDPGAMLAALTMTTAKNERETAKQLRDKAMSAQDAAESAEIKDLHEKADLQRIQGVVDGLCDFAQAGLDAAQGANTLDATLDKAHANALDRDIKGADSKQLVPADMRQANVDAENILADRGVHAEARSNECKVTSEFIGGGKQIADGLFQGAITDKDADEKTHEASATAFKNMVEDFRADENDAKALLNKALDFYKEYVDTKNQTAMAAIHRA